jgi:SnoaL-like domain
LALYTRDEIEHAFANLQDVIGRCTEARDWREWADLFTADAEYVEHHYGRFNGREEIYAFMTRAIEAPGYDGMVGFPVEWYVIDEDKGWVVCCIQTVMRDLGDGVRYQAPNWSLLKYAGESQWAYEEDIYYLGDFEKMIVSWNDAQGH